MSRLEDLRPNAAVKGILPDGLVTVVTTQWFGSEALELTYKTAAGKVANELLYRHDEARFEVVEEGRPWRFDGDGALFRLVSEAHRIRLAHLFDPLLAVHTSLVDPLPHQITAVYGSMLPRQPLRFLLADDPGAGKTIMAGLLIKELIARGDLQRCLVVCPGMLHHLVRAFEHAGEAAAAQLLTKYGSKADVVRELAYRLYTACERKKRAKEAGSYNALVQSWPEIARLAKEAPGPVAPRQVTGLFDQE